MKPLALLLLLFMGILFSFEAHAQAEIVLGNTYYFNDGEGGKFESIDSKTVTSPSGNVLKTITFKLPEGHFLVPQKGKEYVPVGIVSKDETGKVHAFINYNVKVGKSGEFKVVLHQNSAGYIYPLGW